MRIGTSPTNPANSTAFQADQALGNLAPQANRTVQTSLWATAGPKSIDSSPRGAQAHDSQRILPPTWRCMPPIDMGAILRILIGIISRILGQILSQSKELANDQTAAQSGLAKPSTGGKGGMQVDGANGFLWKPVSDSNGKLAILTPKNLTGRIEEVVVKDASGRVLERGRMTGVGNGDREHFRFGRSGSAFPPNVTVEVRLKDGAAKTYPIADPSQRYD